MKSSPRAAVTNTTAASSTTALTAAGRRKAEREQLLEEKSRELFTLNRDLELRVKSQTEKLEAANQALSLSVEAAKAASSSTASTW